MDDNATEGPGIAKLLNDNSTLVCTSMRPAASFSTTLAALRTALGPSGPRVALLDYRLDDRDAEGGGKTEFRGGTVAGFLRDVDPDLPIILVTSDDKLRAWVQTRPGVESVFDWTLIKNEIVKRDQTAVLRARVADVAHAWVTLTAAKVAGVGVWEELAAVLEVPSPLLEPYARLETDPPRADVPGAVARWLLHQAIGWDGPLVRGAQARVNLGVTDSTFLERDVQVWLGDAQYGGPLQAFGPRWWSGRIHDRVVQAAGGTRPIEASARAELVAEATGVRAEPELCQWCGGERTVRACWLCGRASDAAHAIRLLVHAPPAWADVPVACYSCIAEGAADEDVAFPPEADELVEDLKSGRLSPPDR